MCRLLLALLLCLAPLVARAQYITYFATPTNGDLVYWVSPGVLGDSLISQSGNQYQFPVGITLDQGGASPSAALYWYNAWYITSPAAYTIQIAPPDDAAPEASDTLQARSTVAGTSNGSAAALVLQGGKGTGTGNASGTTSGAVILAASPPGSSGTTQNAPVNVVAAKADGTFQFLRRFTVATLLATAPCNGNEEGAETVVTDANSPTYLGALTGGASTVTKVLCNGSAWVGD